MTCKDVQTEIQVVSILVRYSLRMGWLLWARFLYRWKRRFLMFFIWLIGLAERVLFDMMIYDQHENLKPFRVGIAFINQV